MSKEFDEMINNRVDAQVEAKFQSGNWKEDKSQQRFDAEIHMQSNHFKYLNR